VKERGREGIIHVIYIYIYIYIYIVYILYRHVKCTCKHHLDISIALSPGPCRVTPLPSPLTRLTPQQASLLQARGLGVPGVGMLPPPTVGGCPTCVCVCLCVCVSARLCAGASVCLCLYVSVGMCVYACVHACAKSVQFTSERTKTNLCTKTNSDLGRVAGLVGWSASLWCLLYSIYISGMYYVYIHICQHIICRGAD
jgi:hypothetical protein